MEFISELFLWEMAENRVEFQSKHKDMVALDDNLRNFNFILKDREDF